MKNKWIIFVDIVLIIYAVLSLSGIIPSSEIEGLIFLIVSVIVFIFSIWKNARKE